MITEEFKKDFEKVYAIRDTGDIETIREFCEKWDDEADVCHIPYMMRMFSGNSEVMPTQNEFVWFVIGTIFNKNVNATIKCIVENLYILEEEQSQECVSDCIMPIIYTTPDNRSLLAECLVNQKQEYQDLVINCVKDDMADSIRGMSDPRFKESNQSAYNNCMDFYEKYEELLKKSTEESENIK